MPEALFVFMAVVAGVCFLALLGLLIMVLLGRGVDYEIRIEDVED